MMPTSMSPEAQGSSTRPYLIRALHDWCTDNGFTPYLAVVVDGAVQVPMEYVKNHEIVLNVGFDATSGLQLGNEFIEFKARFGGMAREIVVPVDHVVAIYARENGQGMAFPAPKAESAQDGDTAGAGASVGVVGASRPSAPVIALPKVDATRPPLAVAEQPAGADDPHKPPTGGRPALKRIK